MLQKQGPPLLHPLVNVVFNCPNMVSSPLNKLYREISELNDWILLVPPINILRHYQMGGKSFLDWSQDIEFIKNHIILKARDSNNDKDNQIFQNLNGFNIYINSKNNCLTIDGSGVGNGKINIIDSNWMYSLNDWLQSNDKPNLLLYIDKPIFNMDKFEPLQRIDSLKNFKCNFYGTSLTASNKLSHLTKDKDQLDQINFENLINSNLAWKARLKECFIEFKLLINKKRNKTDNNKILILNFKQIINQLNVELSRDRNFQKLPNLTTLIHEYVESKLYNDIWDNIVKNQSADINNQQDDNFYINNLSLDQLDTDFYNMEFNKFDLYYITQLEQNCKNAINKLMNLASMNNYSGKAKILIGTLQILTKNLKKQRGNSITGKDENQIIINADTLMNLFILVINRLKLKNLKCHLFYLQNFNIDDENTRFGLLGYAISTLEATICYMEELQAKNNQRQDGNSLNLFLNYINSNDISNSNQSLFDIDNYLKYLNFRNDKGQSILSQCIINFKNELAKKLLSKDYEKWLPLEDLLDDQDMEGSTLVLQSLKIGNFELAKILIDIILHNCTNDEIKLYFNRLDKNNRHVGYYLNDQIELLKKIGDFIDWNNKDSTNQTALFTIVRSYDQSNYDLMVQAALQIVKNWNANELGFQVLKLNVHEDMKGNTLLHILKSNISIILNDPKLEININKCNDKNLTPLMVYVKYNRFENVNAILNDDRLLIFKTNDPKKVTSFDHTRDKNILHLLSKHILLKYTIFGNIFVHSLKFHQNMSYSIKMTGKIDGNENDKKYETINLNFNVIKKLIKLIVNKFPFFFLPMQDMMIKCHILDENMGKVPKLCQLQYRDLFLRQLTNYLDTLIEFDIIPREVFFDEEIKLLEWIQEEKTHLQKKRLQKEKELSNIVNNRKNEKTKLLLEPEEINVIQNFLKFNVDEIKNWKDKLIIFKKISIFLQFENNDVQTSKELIQDLANGMKEVGNLSTDHGNQKSDSENVTENKNENENNSVIDKPNNKSIKDMSKILFGYTKIDNKIYGDEPFNVLIENLEFLIACTKTLLNHMNQLLNVKITDWWKEYGEILELKRKQNKLSIEHGDTINKNTKPGSNINIILSNLLDNNKYKDKEKIILQINNIKNKMIQMNDDIVATHEIIAVSISQFIEFRKKIISHGIIKLWVQNNIKLTNEELISNRELQSLRKLHKSRKRA